MVSKNYKTCSIQFLFHLLIALPINFLHHPSQVTKLKQVSHLGVVTLLGSLHPSQVMQWPVASFLKIKTKQRIYLHRFNKIQSFFPLRSSLQHMLSLADKLSRQTE
jgi:hypothetical protein